MKRSLPFLIAICILLLACRAPEVHGVTIANSGAAKARVIVLTLGVAIILEPAA